MDCFVAGQAEDVVVEVGDVEGGEVVRAEHGGGLEVEGCFEVFEGERELEDVNVGCADVGAVLVGDVEAGGDVHHWDSCTGGCKACRREESGGLHGGLKESVYLVIGTEVSDWG